MLLTVACGDVIEPSHNGTLDGYWQMTQVDTLATGHSADMLEERRFLSVQGPLLLLKQIGNGSYLFRFSHEGDSLLLYDARYDNRNGGDSTLTDVRRLEPFGLTRLEEHFHVDELTSSRLALNNGRYRIQFRKY